MLRAILNKSWRQHPARHQLYGQLPPITKTIQVRRTRHAGHCWRNRDELISDVLLWTPTYGRAKAGRPARTYIQQLCEDTGCSPEDLPEAMNDREKWRERVRDIRAIGTTWWWWSPLYACFPGLWCICSSLVYFKNSTKYLMRRTTQEFIYPLIRFNFLLYFQFLFILPQYLYLWLCSCYIVLSRVAFCISWKTLSLFLSTLLVWWCPLPLFPSICRFPFFSAFLFFLDLVVAFHLHMASPAFHY